jgi:hypothetical protein
MLKLYTTLYCPVCDHDKLCPAGNYKKAQRARGTNASIVMKYF